MIPFGRMVKYGNIAPASTFIESVSMGTSHMVLLSSTGTLYGTGINTNGELGFTDLTFDSSGTWTIINNNVKKAWACSNYTVLIKNDNTVWYAGNNGMSLGIQAGWRQFVTEVQDIDVSLIKDIFCSNYMMHILMQDGKLYCLGYNRNRNSGLGNTTQAYNIATLIPNAPTNILYIRYSWATGTAFAYTTSNQVYAWGYNTYGEIGTGNSTAVGTPGLIRNNIRMIGTSYNSMFFASSVQLASSGSSQGGQLGNGIDTSSNILTSTARTYDGSYDLPLISPVLGSGSGYTSGFMSTTGLYSTGVFPSTYGSTNTTGLLVYTKVSELPVPINDVLSFCSSSRTSSICSRTELWQCGRGSLMVGYGTSDINYGYRKIKLPW